MCHHQNFVQLFWIVPAMFDQLQKFYFFFLIYSRPNPLVTDDFGFQVSCL